MNHLSFQQKIIPFVRTNIPISIITKDLTVMEKKQFVWLDLLPKTAKGRGFLKFFLLFGLIQTLFRPDFGKKSEFRPNQKNQTNLGTL